MTALRTAVVLAYLPVLAALGLLAAQCAFLLLHARPAGLFGLAYGGALLLLCRRAARIYRGEAAPSWLDLALLLAADALLGVIFINVLV